MLPYENAKFPKILKLKTTLEIVSRLIKKVRILTEFSTALTAAESCKKATVRMRIIIARQQSSILTALVRRYI